MKVLRREWFEVSHSDQFQIVPLGDIHLGAAGCDERLLAATVKDIEETGAYWVGLGDYCEFINRSDRRFDPATVAPWIRVQDLADLPRRQADRFLAYVEPIADRCLGLVCGNHEYSIDAKYERDIYSDIVNGIKSMAGHPAEYPLALGYCGWIKFVFYWGADRKGGSRVLTAFLQHGATAGKLAGSKVLDLQRLLWWCDADLILCGHSHSTVTDKEDGLSLAKNDRPTYKTRKGAHCGSFLGEPIEADQYHERRGFYHAPVGTIRVTLRPGAARQPDRVLITT